MLGADALQSVNSAGHSVAPFLIPRSLNRVNSGMTLLRFRLVFRPLSVIKPPGFIRPRSFRDYIGNLPGEPFPPSARLREFKGEAYDPRREICLLDFLSFLLLSAVAFGQGGVAAGDLHLTVKDPKDNVVTNATVTARDLAKGLERTANGDGEGGYSVRQLPPGSYSVTVETPGFTKVENTGVIITVGGLVELPVILSVAGGKAVVEVSSQAELVETSRSSTTDTIGQRRIDNLPINGRNYINFTLTDSQVVRDNAPNTGAAPTSGLNMSGQRARSNLVNVDGADATDNSTNGVRSTVSQEAVQEFQIITNSYAAEYGRAAGGVVNIITRSGSNDFPRRCVWLPAQSEFPGGESLQHGSEPGLYARPGGSSFWGSDQER